MSEPFLFARIGWTERYEGDEQPIRGGSYNEQNIGDEIFNFKPFGEPGQLYGYFRTPRKSTVKLERIVPGTTGDELHNVLVIFVAPCQPPERGQTTVGCYKNATVYRDRRTGVPEKNRVYVTKASAKDAVLLPLRRRQHEIPRGKSATGQSNVCYPYEPDGSAKTATWIEEALKFIDDYQGEDLLKQQKSESDPRESYP